MLFGKFDLFIGILHGFIVLLFFLFVFLHLLHLMLEHLSLVLIHHLLLLLWVEVMFEVFLALGFFLFLWYLIDGFLIKFHIVGVAIDVLIREFRILLVLV